MLAHTIWHVSGALSSPAAGARSGARPAT